LFKGQFDLWTKEDTYWQACLTALELIDWNQTRQTKFREEHNLPEDNPYLGKWPSKYKVDEYFTFCVIGETAIAYILPKYYRRLWQTSIIILEMHCINKNLEVGIKMKF
jgi:hypothetical protein